MAERRPRLSLRGRMVLIGTATVVLVLVVGGLFLGLAVRRTLVANTRDTIVARAQDIGVLAVRGSLSGTIEGNDDESLVQVVGADGAVLAATANIVGRPALRLRPQPVARTTVRQVGGLPIDDDGAGFLVATTTVVASQGPVTVHVAASLDDVAESIVATNTAALVTLPLLVAVLAGVLWVLVGRTLVPVAAMTAQADAIGADALHRRLPEPEHLDEVGVLARTLNRMLGRLDVASRRQRRFVADAAHELRAPITNLRTELETARAHADQVDWTQVSGGLLSETVRLQELTEQLLLLARIERDGFAPRAGPVDLDDVVERAVERAERHGRQLAVDGLQPVRIDGDSILLEHALANVVDNALRHATATVHVGLRRRGGLATVVVDDDGPGIPADCRDDVLRPFTRLDDARDRDAGGAGLGLAIAADIATAHGGAIEIDDGPLGGARVRLAFPVTDMGT